MINFYFAQRLFAWFVRKYLVAVNAAKHAAKTVVTPAFFKMTYIYPPALLFIF